MDALDPTIQQLLMTVLTVAASTLVGWLLGGVKGAAKERKAEIEEQQKDRDTTRAALRLLLFYRIADTRDAGVQAGCLSASEKHQLEEAYAVYSKDLGGNGAGTQLYREAMSLPTE